MPSGSSLSVTQHRSSSPCQASTAATPLRGEHLRFARAYSTNEIIYAAIDLLSDSASEPQIVGRRYRRESPRVMNRLEMRRELKDLVAKGLSYREADQRLIRNGFYEAMPSHPLVMLLNNPNPMSSRGSSGARW
jgi:hypothetical protein